MSNGTRQAKLPKTKSSHGYGCVSTTSKTSFQAKDRKLASTSPLKEQFEPTDAEPISQRKRMGGY